ncbi:MAG: autotransporter outer membrane beta-barrel domain-containing protein, partial [Syntrophales bacterium]|nr:autotransporter outer membrane beta-barrel domain-containing protein [Syntrophales bacterium]
LMLAMAGNIGHGQLAGGTNWGLWMDGYYGLANRRSDDMIARYKERLYGGVIGFDYRITSDLYLGISAGIAHAVLDFDNLIDNGKMNSYQGSVYLCYNGMPWYAEGVFTYAYNSYNLDRYITTLGPTMVANSSYNGNEYIGYGELGYKFDIGGVVEIRPLAAFQVDYLTQDAFAETGAGIYNLIIDKQNTGSYKSFLGLNILGNIKLGTSAALKPELRAKWGHEFSNDDHMITARFEGLGPGSFTVSPETLSRDSAILGAGLNLLFNKHASLYVQYDAELNRDYINHTGLVGLRFSW